MQSKELTVFIYVEDCYNNSINKKKKKRKRMVIIYGGVCPPANELAREFLKFYSSMKHLAVIVITIPRQHFSDCH
jgi:hypothetical protein